MPPPAPFTCPATASNKQICSCKNVTNSTTKKWSWVCDCLRNDTKVTKSFEFDQSLCALNATTSKYECCLSKAQLDTQVVPPTPFKCPSNASYEQTCTCRNVTNSTTMKWSWKCDCTNDITKITKPFDVEPSLCQCNGTTKCDCCLSKTQVGTQVPPVVPFSCPSTATNREQCTCKNVTNSTTKQWYWDCSCLRNDTKVTKDIPFQSSLCQCNGTTKCECCLTKT